MRPAFHSRHDSRNVLRVPVSNILDRVASLVDRSRRLLKYAVELHKPVLLLNVGPSRADGHPGVEKIDIASGTIMRDVVKAVVYVSFYLPCLCANIYKISGARASEDPVVRELLQSGIMQPPLDDDDRDPRAAG